LRQRVNQKLDTKEKGTAEPPGRQTQRRRTQGQYSDSGTDHQHSSSNEPGARAPRDLRPSRRRKAGTKPIEEEELDPMAAEGEPQCEYGPLGPGCALTLSERDDDSHHQRDEASPYERDAERLVV
jgi:hypothetical protein